MDTHATGRLSLVIDILRRLKVWLLVASKLGLGIIYNQSFRIVPQFIHIIGSVLRPLHFKDHAQEECFISYSYWVQVVLNISKFVFDSTSLTRSYL